MRRAWLPLLLVLFFVLIAALGQGTVIRQGALTLKFDKSTAEPGELVTVSATIPVEKQGVFELKNADGLKLLGSRKQTGTPIGEKRRRALFTFLLGDHQAAGTYDIAIRATGQNIEQVASVSLKVPRRTGLRIDTQREPSDVEPGSNIQVPVTVTNPGNTTLNVGLELSGFKSQAGTFEHSFTDKTLTVEPGQRRETMLAIAVPMDTPRDRRSYHTAKITGRALNEDDLRATTYVDFFVTPSGFSAHETKNSNYPQLKQTITQQQNYDDDSRSEYSETEYSLEGEIADETTLSIDADRISGDRNSDPTRIRLDNPDWFYNQGGIRVDEISLGGQKGWKAGLHPEDDYELQLFEISGFEDRAQGIRLPYTLDDELDGLALYSERSTSRWNNRHFHRISGTVRGYNHIPLHWTLSGHYWESRQGQTETLPGFSLRTGWHWFNHTVRLQGQSNVRSRTEAADDSQHGQLHHRYEKGDHRLETDMYYDRDGKNWLDGRGRDRTQMTLDGRYEHTIDDENKGFVRYIYDDLEADTAPAVNQKRITTRAGIDHESTRSLWNGTLRTHIEGGYEHQVDDRADTGTSQSGMFYDGVVEHRLPVGELIGGSWTWTNRFRRNNDAERLDRLGDDQSTRFNSQLVYDHTEYPLTMDAQVEKRESDNGQQSLNGNVDIEYHPEWVPGQLSLRSSHDWDFEDETERWRLQANYTNQLTDNVSLTVDGRMRPRENDYEAWVGLTYDFTTPAYWHPKRGTWSGRVYHDKNTNGRFDDADTPVEGAVISLREAGVRTETGSDGRFRVDGIEPGQYQPDVSLPTSILPAQATDLPDQVTIREGSTTRTTLAASRLVRLRIRLRFEQSKRAQLLGLNPRDRRLPVRFWSDDKTEAIGGVLNSNDPERSWLIAPGTYSVEVAPRLSEYQTMDEAQKRRIDLKHGEPVTLTYTIRQEAPPIKKFE